MPSILANLAYYRAVEGRWRGPFVFHVTDWRGFFAARMGVAERWRVLAMAVVTRLFGPLTMETSVDCSSAETAQLVIHTTRLLKWNSVLYESFEQMLLDGKGKDVCVRREERYPPSRRRVAAERDDHTVVDPSGRRAAYDLELFGAAAQQQVEIVSSGVGVTQTTPWFRGDIALARPDR